MDPVVLRGPYEEGKRFGERSRYYARATASTPHLSYSTPRPLNVQKRPGVIPHMLTRAFASSSHHEWRRNADRPSLFGAIHRRLTGHENSMARRRSQLVLHRNPIAELTAEKVADYGVVPGGDTPPFINVIPPLADTRKIRAWVWCRRSRGNGGRSYHCQYDESRPVFSARRQGERNLRRVDGSPIAGIIIA